MNKRIHIIFVSMVCLLASCIEEPLKSEETDGATAYLLVRSGNLLSSTDSRDNEINTLRILAFSVTGRCVSNVLYHATLNETIQHPINEGNYDFVFLANEPDSYAIQNALNSVTRYADLRNIKYPESCFDSDVAIPMYQEIKDVNIIRGGGGAQVGDGPVVNPLVLKLERLASRVDIVLEAEEDLTAYFTGVTFSGIPDGIKLMSADNSAFDRNITRKYTLTDDADYFSSATPNAEQQSRGIVWVRKITRFIMPFNNFTPVDNADKAFELTVDMVNRYSPSCKLKIATNGVDGASKDNYTLPFNSALLLTGVVKVPLELNVKITPWGEEQHNWQVGDRYLNVSEINVNITDYNAARITFSSNMPVVKVLPDVFVNNSLQTLETGKVFNDLILAAGETSTTRFAYTYDAVRGEGSGYMDILLDEYNMDIGTFLANQNGRHTIFGLVLSAEDENGGNQLQREIKVNTSQYGVRVVGNQWTGLAYVGTFHRENEVGERIISTQVPRLTNQGNAIGYWDVVVDDPYKSQIILSTTPSFDPYAGTDTPGEPEDYSVRPNEYKRVEVDNDGTKITGKGRIYFRVGWRGPNPNSGGAGQKLPRYATITVTFTQAGTAAGGWRPSYKIYLRQGEADDYIMKPETTIADGPLKDQSRNYARKFSAFNLTDPDMKNEDDSYSLLYAQTPKRQGVFVDYPTQAGAFYQWGLPKTDNSLTGYFRRAYHPAQPAATGYPSTGYWSQNYVSKIPMWASSGPGATTAYEYGYGSEFEICPTGYHRPSDGYIDQTAYNGKYSNFRWTSPQPPYSPTDIVYVDFEGLVITQVDYSGQIATSEWRHSLWKNPWAGESVSGTGTATVGKDTPNEKTVVRERTSPAYVENKDIYLLYGFYADGYYDRRPMKVQPSTTTANTRLAVSVNSPSVAYRGSVVYNPETDASVFFPGAGRRKNNDNGKLESPSGTAYYWTSTMAPTPPTGTGRDNQAAWSIELNYSGPGHVYTMTTYGYSIRCVKDEVIYVR